MFVLFLHFMYCLQSLDILLFLSFVIVYINRLNKLIFDNFNIINILKWTFWNLFYSAWLISFISKNIVSGFEKVGIFSYNPHKTFSITAKLKPNIQSDIPDILKTLLTSLDIYCIDCACRLAPTPLKFQYCCTWSISSL